MNIYIFSIVGTDILVLRWLKPLIEYAVIHVYVELIVPIFKWFTETYHDRLLNMQDKPFLVFYQKGHKLSAPIQCWEIIINGNGIRCLCFPKQVQHNKG